VHMDSLDSSNSDLSLIGLLSIFYQKKVLIFLTTLLGLVVGFAVIFFSKPVYEAAITLSAATEGDIAAFNIGRSWDKSPLKPMNARDIYLVFSTELVSEAVKLNFFKQFYLPSLSANQKNGLSPEELYARFVKNFAVVESPKTFSERFGKFVVAIRGYEPKQLSLGLKQFLDLVKAQTTHTILDNIKQQNSVIVSNLQHQIELARTSAKLRRQDRIVQLKDTLRVAQLENENDMFDSGPDTAYPSNPELLRAEIKNLSERRSDDAFILNLRELQAELGFYKSLAVNPDKVAVFHLDGTIETPNMPVEPRRKLIMMVSLALGFMTGIFCVMFQIAWRKEHARAL
jgi:chain length determinant protein (polysaccharide antigen chain regulator)